jgi:NAD dependent epimerase/dehydratase family enzyme
MGDELLLSGQHVYPARLIDQGFKFAYPEIAAALQQMRD